MPYIPSLSILRPSLTGKEDILRWSIYVLLSMKNRNLNFALDCVYFFGENPRNVIEEKQGKNQFVAEEMLLWGYRGSPSDNEILDAAEIKALMTNALPSANLTDQARAGFLESEL